MRNSKSGLFLMEMIISILVFSISAAVCIQIFAKAYTTSKNTQVLNSSVTLCSSAAELFYGFKGDMSKIQRQLDPRRMSIASVDKLVFYYDEDFNLTYEGLGVYRMTLKNQRSEDMLTTNISMTSIADSSTIYYLDCRLYKRGSLSPSGSPGADSLDAGVQGAGVPGAGGPDTGVPGAGGLDSGVPGAGGPDTGISQNGIDELPAGGGAVTGGVL